MQLRKSMGNVDYTEAFAFIVEADETYVGGNPKWRKSKQIENKQPSKVFKTTTKRGRSTDKTPVFGIKERMTGRIHAVVMPLFLPIIPYTG